MKIIGGIAKGRRLKDKVKNDVRPTGAKVREALFNIIGQNIYGSIFLDLYAGTGLIGFEALARGASATVFVDRDTKYLERFIKLHKYTDCKVIEGEVDKAVNILFKQGQRFEFIYVDPPYFSDEIDIVLPLLDQILLIDGLIIVEHFHKRLLGFKYGLIEKIKDYRYGDTILTFYKKG